MKNELKYDKNDINQRLQQIEVLLTKIDERIKKQPELAFFDNEELCLSMNISKKTAQNWRSENLIGYSQIRGKYYYKLTDIFKLLEKNYVPPKNN
jgi:hypothetical protein